ncbi:hypothetical protein [Mangrovibacter phragmitis]|uniref:hypothetical protein n=1 Tax=Mangrovibacter phragmitis TaxID=1691903 RepID=UPI00336AC01F
MFFYIAIIPLVLLAVIAYLLAVISSKINGLYTNTEAGSLYNARLEHQKYILNDALAELENIKDSIERNNETLNDIKYVTDIILKYKLPDASERKMLDEVRLNEEVWDGINQARNDA